MLIATALLLAATALNPAQQVDEDEMALAENSIYYESDLFGQDQDQGEVADLVDAVTVQPEEEESAEIYYHPVWKSVR